MQTCYQPYPGARWGEWLTLAGEAWADLNEAGMRIAEGPDRWCLEPGDRGAS